MIEGDIALPLRVDSEACVLGIFVVYDTHSRFVRELASYEEALAYVSAANGVEIADVDASVARESRLRADYMQNLNAKTPVREMPTGAMSSRSQPQSAPVPSAETSASASRYLLDLTRRGEEPDSLALVLRALEGATEDADQYAFYLGRPRRPLDEIWGDNDRSFLAQIDRVSLGAGDDAFLVTLMQDGGISRFLGAFAHEQDALKCLARHGRYDKP